MEDPRGVRLACGPIEVESRLVGRRAGTVEAGHESSVERFEAFADHVAPLGVEAMLQFLDFGSFVLYRDLRLLETPPKILIPVSEVSDQLVAPFCSKAAFDSSPFPLNS